MFREAAGRSRLTSASVRARHGHFDVTIGAIERWFVVSIWSRGVQMTMGKTKTLDAVVAVVAAVAAWTPGAGLTDLHAACPFLETTDLALAPEQGPAAAVTEKWHQLRTRWSSDQRFRRTADVIEAAYAEPKFRPAVPLTPVTHPCASAPVLDSLTAKAFRASTWASRAT